MEHGAENTEMRNSIDFYGRQLVMENHTRDEQAEAAYHRGEEAFRGGRYIAAVEAMLESLGAEKTKKYEHLEMQAYNTLGTLLSFAGYEANAVVSYLAAERAAEKIRDDSSHVVVLLNEGLLYQGLRDHRRALDFCQQAYDLASGNFAKPDLSLVLACLIQKAQLLCRLERYNEAKKLKREIDSYCQAIAPDEFLLSKGILEVYLEEYFGTEESTAKRIERVREYLEQDEEWLGQMDAYLDFCSYLLDRDKREVKEFLDLLRERLRTTDFLRLRMGIEEMEVVYQKKYAGEEDYLKACCAYMEERKAYEGAKMSLHRQTIVSLEELQRLLQEQRRHERIGKCDFATGFLTKEAFRDEVRQYFQEKSRSVMDVLMVIEIDDLRLVNDQHGHAVGDEMIAALVKLIKESFTGEGVCGRLGRNEFAVFLENVKDMAEIEEKIEALREQFSDLGFGEKKEVSNTVSIGVSYNHGIDTSYQSMFSCAQEALFKVKEYGKNKVAFFEIKRGLVKHVEQ